MILEAVIIFANILVNTTPLTLKKKNSGFYIYIYIYKLNKRVTLVVANVY